MAEVNPFTVSNDAVPGESEFEAAYQRLGRVRGPDSSPDIQLRNRDFWLRSGQEGVPWLIGRLRGEFHVDVLDAAAALLGEMGEVALPLIVAELEKGGSSDLVETLLRGLRRIELSPANINYQRVVSCLENLCGDMRADVREIAYSAASRLQREDAQRLLKRARAVETDPELTGVLSEIWENLERNGQRGA